MQRAEIFEMGPRDGLQNEKRLIPAAEKIALVDLLSRAGFRRIEVTSFVSPKWVPQMADAAEVMAGITRTPGISYAVLTPNMKGYEGARAARANEVAIFASASEGFSKANLNATIAESLERFAPVAQAAKADGIRVRGYVSVVTDCPYDGPTPPANVARVAAALRDLGPGLGDVALRVCCHLEGLEVAEKRMGWAARSGKIVLRIALMRLKRHYEETYGGASPLIG